MIKRLEELFQGESKASFSLSQEVKDRLKEFDEKIERLVDIFIERQITQDEYTKRKAKLLNNKKDLQEKLGEIEKSSYGWLEPAKQFVTTCNQAGSVAWQRKFLRSAKNLKNLLIPLCGIGNFKPQKGFFENLRLEPRLKRHNSMCYI